jgi:acetyl esterase/lipase
MTSKLIRDPRIDPRIKAMFAGPDQPPAGDIASREALLAEANSPQALAAEAARTSFLDAFATEADVKGLPPTIINVNECDPLRDEGVNFYRLLLRTVVPARCRQLMGTTHSVEVLWPARTSAGMRPRSWRGSHGGRTQLYGKIHILFRGAMAEANCLC